MRQKAVVRSSLDAQRFLDLWLVAGVVLALSLAVCYSCLPNQVRFYVFCQKGKGEKVISSVFPV